MRRLLMVTSFSVLASVLVGACGDDSGNSPGIGGTGGTTSTGGSAGSGTGGSAGSAGSAGAGTGGNAGTGNAGTAGTGSGGPDAGDAGPGDGDAAVADAAAPPDATVGPPCTGCVELRTPFTAINQAAFFQIGFTSDDLNNTVATFRLRAQLLDETGQLSVTPFATDGSGFTFGAGAPVLIDAAVFTDTNTFVDVAFDVSTVTAAGFDNTDVIALGLQVSSGGTFVGPATEVLLLDSITYTGSSALPNLDFTADAQGMAVNAFAGLQTATVVHD